MGTKRLSDRELLVAKPRAARYQISDGGGLYLEVLPSGAKSWRIEFRVKGEDIRERMTLGKYPDLSLVEARSLAAQIRAKVAGGANPAAVERADRERKKAERGQQLVASKETGDALLDLFIANVVRVRRRDPRQMERTVEGFLRKPFKGRLVADFARTDVEAIVLPIRDRGRPAMASAVLRLLRQVFNHAVDLGWRADNPARTIKADQVHISRSRSRTLSQAELSTLLRAVYASNISRPIKLAVHLLVLTACRKSEVTGARWAEIDKDRQTWVIPAERHKMGREHSVFLSVEAIELLDEARDLSMGSEFVFASHKKPGVSMSSSTINQALRTIAWDGAAFVVHDLRRTMVTLANELGMADPHVIEHYVGHVIGGTVARTYNRAMYTAERRALAEKWGAFVADLIGDRKVIVGRFGRAKPASA